MRGAEKTRGEGSLKDSGKIVSLLFLIERYVRILAVIWTIIVAASLVWSIVRIKKDTLEGARLQAHISYVKDILYRQWNAGHGGIYVPVTEQTPPNPYLSDIAERDVTTPSGKRLTLMNPAYMTRQVYGLMEKTYGVRGHITSLKPIRPENGPDPWESQTLRAFEMGQSAISSIANIDGKVYYRQMYPFATEAPCLKCHAKQGYREGDVRGGLSVSIPMEPLLAMERRHIVTDVATHGLLWLIGLVGINYGMQRIRRSEHERKAADEALGKVTEELTRSNTDLVQFAYAASHDLQEPLRVISSCVQLLAKRYKGKMDENADELIQYTVNGAKGMKELIRDISDYLQIESGERQFQPVDLSMVIEEAIASLRETIEANGAIVTYQQTPVIVADFAQMRSLFEHLIENAIKFRGEVLPEIHISAERSESEWLFSVHDNGIGIDREFAGKIFDVFKRLHTKEEYPGTGIGLAICRKIIECHGGRIWVDSESGTGSTFSFAIPDRK